MPAPSPSVLAFMALEGVAGVAGVLPSPPRPLLTSYLVKVLSGTFMLILTALPIGGGLETIKAGLFRIRV